MTFETDSKEDAEFISSQTSNCRSTTGHLVGDGPDRLVTDIVSVVVVNSLETIDINQDGAQRRAVTGLPTCLRRFLEESTPIVDPG